MALIGIKSKVKRTNPKALKKIIEEMRRVESGPYVSVGVHGDAGEYPDGTSVYTVAMANEFGTENIPERSFMRAPIAEKRTLIGSWVKGFAKLIVESKETVAHALESIGFRVQVIVQNAIKSNIAPENAPSTIARKERLGVPQRTLIETGLLLRSIGYKVHRSSNEDAE